MEDRKLNQTRSKPYPVDRPVRTAHTFVHHYNSTQCCSTETVTISLPADQRHISDVAKWGNWARKLTETRRLTLSQSGTAVSRAPPCSRSRVNWWAGFHQKCITKWHHLVKEMNSTFLLSSASKSETETKATKDLGCLLSRGFNVR